MKYVQPFDQPTDEDAPYLDMNVPGGVDGSIPPARFFNNVQAELLYVITQAGLTPSHAVLTQLYDAIIALIPPPTGAPSDASLVHYAVDTGAANALIVTPSPTTAGVSAGFTVFCLPINDQTGPSTITVNLDPSGNVVKNIKRADGSALGSGDIKAGRLTAFVYDGTNFRLAWQGAVAVDGVTIIGDGTPSSPLVAIGPLQGPGTNVGQWISRALRPLNSQGFMVANPLGLTIGQVVSAADIANGTISGLLGSWDQSEEPYSVSTQYGSWFGTLSGTWKIAGWFSDLPFYSLTQIYFVRIA